MNNKYKFYFTNGQSGIRRCGLTINQLSNLEEVIWTDLNFERLILHNSTTLTSLKGFPNIKLKCLYLDNNINLTSLEGVNYLEEIEYLSISRTAIKDYSFLAKMTKLETIALTQLEDIEEIIPYLRKIKIEWIAIPGKLLAFRAYKIKYKHSIKLLQSFLLKKIILICWQKFFYPTRFSFVAYYLN